MSEEIEQEIKDYELFEYAIDNFILEIDALAESLPLVMGMVELKRSSHSKKLDKFIDEHKGKDEEGEEVFKIPLDRFNEFNTINKELKSSNAAYSILPRNFVVSLVSQYDAYLGELYRALFQIKPELAFLLEKEFSFHLNQPYPLIHLHRVEVYSLEEQLPFCFSVFLSVIPIRFLVSNIFFRLL